MTEGLIIDDNRQTANALNQMLGVLEFKTRLAYGSSAAMDVLGAGFTTGFYLSGYQYAGCRWDRSACVFAPRTANLTNIPVIVITSDDQPETREKVMGLGATALIIKPATINSLEAALKKAKLSS